MTTTASPPITIGYRLRWPALFVVLAAEILDLLDALITSIAGPTIVRDLGGGETLIQWLTAAYTLAMAGGLLLGGRLGDIYGRRRMFLMAMAGFTALSAACALAQSPGQLVTLRAIQGFVGAMMLPQGLGLIKEMFPPQEVGKAFGMFGPIMGLSSVGGPILAGVLVDADVFGWAWRTIFAINIPIGLVALAVGLRVLPPSRPNRSLHIETTSAAIAAASMVAIVYPLIQGHELGWPVWCFALIAAGVAGFALLALVERRRERAGRVTLIVPSLFTKRAFTGGVAAGTALFGSLMGMMIVFTLLVQVGLGWSPTKAGVAGIPQALGMVVGFIVSQPLMARLGRTVMQIGEAVAIAGLGGLAMTIRLAGDDLNAWHLAPALAALGLGFGMTMAPYFDIALAGVEEHESGSASGVLSSVQQLGGAIGVGALGTLFWHTLAGSGAASPLEGFRTAATAALLLAAGFMAAALLLTFLLPRRARPDAVGH
ncbi:MAG: MFS transporter [Tetrasphaera sp.]